MLAKTAVSTSAIPTAVIGGKNVVVGKNVGGLGGAGARRAFGADVSNADRVCFFFFLSSSSLLFFCFPRY